MDVICPAPNYSASLRHHFTLMRKPHPVCNLVIHVCIHLSKSSSSSVIRRPCECHRASRPRSVDTPCDSLLGACPDLNCSSKDWKWDGLTDNSLLDLATRPFGWLDISLGRDSSLSYVLPNVASSQGYDSLIEIHMDQLAISSSVNYQEFIKADYCRVRTCAHVTALPSADSSDFQVSCQMPSPLKWDTSRDWIFSITFSGAEIFMLRDHTILIADVVKDMTSGPPGDYEHFVPFTYSFMFLLNDFSLYLYLNDHNIINNPTAMDDNGACHLQLSALTFYSRYLNGQLCSPSRDRG